MSYLSPLRASWIALLACLAVVGIPQVTIAAPTINQLSLRGLQTGGTTLLVIEGQQLLPAPQLVLPVPIASQAVRPGATDQRIEIEVGLEASVPVGLVQLRVANDQGISNPAAVVLDRLPQLPFAAEIAPLPAALSGSVSGGEILETRFCGMKDQRVVLEVESRRLGSQLRPVVRLLAPNGAQVAWSPPLGTLGDDARCEARLTADGTYTIQVHDLLYRAAPPGFFRLKVGDLVYADRVQPSAATIGQPTVLTWAATSLPAGTLATLPATRRASRGFIAVPLPDLPEVSGTRPGLLLTDEPQMTEQPSPGEQLQPLPVPNVGVSGQLATAREEDRYLLNVVPGSKLQFEVLARQLGSPLDGVLVLRDVNGQELARNDDRPQTSDPGLEFSVPQDKSQIVVALSELNGQGGPEYFYRLQIVDLGQPDFQLSIRDDRLPLARGGMHYLMVAVTRRHYAGPIRLHFEGLPPDIEVAGGEIPAHGTVALVSLRTPSDLLGGGIATLLGTASDIPNLAPRRAEVPPTEVNQRQPWLRSETAWGTAPAGPVRLEWSFAGSPSSLVRGGKLPLTVRVARDAAAIGKLRLRLVTTQPMPQKTVQQDNKEVVVDDPERALRLEGEPLLEPAATEATVELLVPADLPDGPWTLGLVADLLGPDDKTVLATAAGTLRTLVATPAGH